MSPNNGTVPPHHQQQHQQQQQPASDRGGVASSAPPPQSEDPASQEPVADLDALLSAAIDGVSTPAFDTYAFRHLVAAPPAATAHLSSLAVTPRRVLRRYDVTAAGGERCIMTLVFEYHGPSTLAAAAATATTAASPANANAAAAPPASGWVLTGATGEPAGWAEAGPPLGPSPEHPPEAVVASLLAALRDLDVFTAWRLLAPPARAAAGGSAEALGAALEAPAMRPLLLHGGAARVLARQRGAARYSEVVRVEDMSGEWHQFCISAALAPPAATGDRCWRVESIAPVGPDGCSDPRDCGADGPCAVPENWGPDAE